MVSRSAKRGIGFDIDRCRRDIHFQQAPFKQLVGRQAINGTFKLHPEVKQIFNERNISRFVQRAGIVYMLPDEVQKILNRDKQSGRWFGEDLADFTDNRPPLLSVTRGPMTMTQVEAREPQNTAFELSASIAGGDLEALQYEKLQIASRYDSYASLSPSLYLGHLEGPDDAATLELVRDALDATSSLDMRVGKIALQ